MWTEITNYIKIIEEKIYSGTKMKSKKYIRLNTEKLKEDIYNIRYALAMIIVYMVVTQIIFGSVCPMVIIFKYPCPACGLTRACISILTGHFMKAVDYNVTAYLWMPLIAWLFIMRYFTNKKKIYWEIPVIFVGMMTIFYYVYSICSDKVL